MTNISQLLFPCCGATPQTKEGGKPSSSAALKQAALSYVMAAVTALGVALAAYTLTQGSIQWTAISATATTLVAGSVFYVAIRCSVGNPKTITVSVTKQEKIEHTAFSPEWRGALATTLYSYGGELSNKRKKAIEYVPLKEGDAELSLRFKKKKYDRFEVSFRAQEIFESGAQVIVNAANTHLGGGGGIDGDIHREGGESYKKGHFALRDEYQRHPEYEKQYVPGHAALIGSGQLKDIDKVIVVAGPNSNFTSEQAKDALYSCYYNSLTLAHMYGYNSFACPGISTGVFGFPRKEAAKITLKAVVDFIKDHPKSPLRFITFHCRPNEKEFLSSYQEALEITE